MKWIPSLLIFLSILMIGRPSCAHAHQNPSNIDTPASVTMQTDDHAEPCHDMEPEKNSHAEQSQDDAPHPCGDDCDGGITCKSCDLAPVAILSLNQSKQVAPTTIATDHKPVHAFFLSAAYDPPPPKYLFKT